MRVLVTRPASSGERTAEKLQARGHEAILMPLTEAVHDVDAIEAGLTASVGALAITSAEAVRAMQALGPALSPHLVRLVFAVGKATADEAIKAGFTKVIHSDGDGARLADLVVAERRLHGEEPLLYLGGQPRASGFEKRLFASGIAFNVCECYRMKPVGLSNTDLEHYLRDDPIDAILFYSRHSAELFFGLDFVRANIKLLKNIRLLCLSATIATIVPQDLASMVEIAATPEEESLLTLLDAAERPILI